MTYDPSRRLVGDHSPQTHPEEFSDEDVRKEIKYLLRLNKRYGEHPLRTAAALKLAGVLNARKPEPSV